MKIIMDLNKMTPKSSQRGSKSSKNLMMSTLVKNFEKKTILSPKLQINLNACLSE